MGSTLGIDLGTTHCCVCAVKDGVPTTVPSPTGARTTPAIVAFGRTGEVLVGEPARRQAPYIPERTITSVKRLLGRKFHTPAMDWLRDACPYTLVPAGNGDVWIRVDDQAYSPPELVAVLLEHLTATAETYLDEPVDEAVLCVPSSFGEPQRRALRDAAQIAGLNVQRLINATTAAALAYAFDHGAAQRVAILDFGGGCFDVGVVEYGDGVVTELAHAGDPMLGGDDFDRCLVDRLADAFFATERIDLAEDATALVRLFEAARMARHELSFSVAANDIELACIAGRDGDFLHLRQPSLKREQFERWVAAELDRVDAPCAWALEDIGLGTDDMQQVLLLGGMSRMPALQQRVEYLFRQPPRKLAGADEMAAQGAALYAAALGGGGVSIELREVSAHSVGIKVPGGHYCAVVGRTAPLPIRQRKAFAPARVDQDRVVLEIYQGEADLVRDNTYLGRVVLEELQPNTAIVTTFALDSDALLTVSAVEPPGEAEQPMKMIASSGLSQSQVMRRAKRHRGAPQSIAPPQAAQASERAAPLPADQSDVAAARAGRRSVRPPPATERPPPLKLQEREEAEQALTMAVDSLVGTTVGDRYLIEEVLAEGGMGRVYRARHKMLARQFAIKVLHAELAADARLADRFVSEAQAASSIRSDYVVDISDFGHLEDGTAFFVMEYLEGSTLAELIERRGALPVQLIRKLGIQLAQGLAAAHDVGVIHRDLKPENVTVIERGEGDYLCKILDFGIAKLPTSDAPKRLTRAGELLGTPYYMAPEQIDGEDVDARADIYSLGAVLYEMATGAPPFDADTLFGMLLKHKQEPPPRIERDVAGRPFPSGLEAIIRRCLAKKPDDRLGSAHELGERLAALTTSTTRR